MNKARRSFILLAVLAITGTVLVIFSPLWCRKNDKYQLPAQYQKELISLGDSAIATFDVPVAAILIYRNNLIGRGYNTVNRHGNIGGHAEINAISDAMAKIGFDSLNRLDRAYLTLITTYEPCKMCEGAITESYIKHVVVIKPKSMKHWFRKWKMRMLYQWNKQTTKSDSLQEYMFRKHPKYDPVAAQQDN
jgi:tRNA(Arg) A34 adenosine deaminase TadA